MPNGDTRPDPVAKRAFDARDARAAAVLAIGVSLVGALCLVVPTPTPLVLVAVAMCLFGEVPLLAYLIVGRAGRARPLSRWLLTVGTLAMLGAVVAALLTRSVPSAAYVFAGIATFLAAALPCCLRTAGTPREAGA